jgi:hypothetical protein
MARRLLRGPDRAVTGTGSMLWHGATWALLAVGLALWAPAGPARGAVFTDGFAERELIAGPQGVLTGSNVGATVETDEPRHGNKRGGHSVWVSWVAPSGGLLRLSTAGSSFDTTLGVYRRENDAGVPATSVTQLERLGDNDDDDDDAGHFPTSATLFKVEAGVRYEIAIDGYAGATGTIQLGWSHLPRDRAIPVVVVQPYDRSVREGESVTLSPGIAFGEDTEYRWYRNDVAVDGAESPILTLPSFGAGDVGRYRLRMKTDDLVYFSASIEVQINTEGLSGAMARNKFFDATETPLRTQLMPLLRDPTARQGVPGPRLQAGPVGVVRGLSGTQIFDTSYAGRDADEPLHCGVAGGATYWFGYECPDNGRLRFDTAGSSFPTILAVYTFDPPLERFDQLVPVACDIADPDAAAVEFAATGGRTYYVVLDGLEGARGQGRIQYHLEADSAVPPVAPRVVRPPESQTVAAGQPLTLSVLLEGTAPLATRWQRDDSDIPGATGTELRWTAVAPSDSGAYRVVVTNLAGGTTSSVATVRVLLPPSLRDLPTRVRLAVGDTLRLVPTVEGSGPFQFRWFDGPDPIPGATAAELVLENLQPAQAGSYELEAVNEVGTARSAAVAVEVFAPPPDFARHPVSQTLAVGAPLLLSALLRGSGPFAYQWWKDGAEYPGATGTELRVGALAPSDSGDYWVVVTGAGGSSTSEVAQVRVLDPPTLPESLERHRVAAGGNFRHEPPVTGSAPLTFRWYLGADPVPGAVHPALVLTNLQPSQTGRYELEIANEVGSQRGAVLDLVVVEPPVIVHHPAPLRAGPAGQVAFTLAAELGEGGRVTWTKDGLPIPGASGLRLELGPCRTSDAGHYQAEVSNLAGIARSTSASLTIVETPHLEIDRATGSVTIEFPAPEGPTCRIEAADGAAGVWLTVTNPPVPANRLVEYRQPATGARSQFFRCLPVSGASPSATPLASP